MSTSADYEVLESSQLFSTIENFPKGKPILAKPDGYKEESLLSIKDGYKEPCSKICAGRFPASP